MQNLSQKELIQIVEMHDQSRGELEPIAKKRRIKNYEKMSKEELVISLSNQNKAYSNSVIIISMMIK